jgi:hypothetical protein
MKTNRFSQCAPGLAASLLLALSPGSAVAKGSTDNLSASVPDIPQRLASYAKVRLTSDLSRLTPGDRQTILHLMRACDVMNQIFWEQTFGDPTVFLGRLGDPALRAYAQLNYGPWDRLHDEQPFVMGYGAMPPGANLYPPDATKMELAALSEQDRNDEYSVIRRGTDRKLTVVPYHQAFAAPLHRAAQELRTAATTSSDPAFASYLKLRAQALETDDFRPSDMAWMDMKSNPIDVVIGPIENYIDKINGARAAYEGVVLVKDQEWSARLAKFTALLPALQRDLPVPVEYKHETPGTNSDLNAYDVLLYAGEANSGGKTIAINLPNDEEVQLQKGTRRLQLKNAIRAKFETILRPVAGELIVPEQMPHVRFEAFFPNVMFHEVAHGLGIKNTLDGKSTVRVALKENFGALEEAKADILGLYLVGKLIEQGELKDTTIEDHYVTFVAGILRSVRFGTGDAHGKANMIEFNFFADRGAFEREAASGRYRVDPVKTRAAVEALAARILRLQGDGNYERAREVVANEGVVRPQLRKDLDRLAAKNIPVDVVFEQGPKVLGLE